VGAAIVAAAGAAGQVLAVHQDVERTGVAPDPARFSWWERQAARHEAAVAGLIAR
jgi:hypothetical protein